LRGGLLLDEREVGILTAALGLRRRRQALFAALAQLVRVFRALWSFAYEIPPRLRRQAVCVGAPELLDQSLYVELPLVRGVVREHREDRLISVLERERDGRRRGLAERRGPEHDRMALAVRAPHVNQSIARRSGDALAVRAEHGGEQRALAQLVQL